MSLSEISMNVLDTKANDDEPCSRKRSVEEIHTPQKQSVHASKVCKISTMDANNVLHPDVESVLYTKDMIDRRVVELAQQISKDYASSEKPVLFAGVLTGAFMFHADLARNITVPLEIDFVSCSSYADATESSGVITVRKDLKCEVQGRDIIVVEDIVDTGLTVKTLCESLELRGARSVKIAALLDKRARRKPEIDVALANFFDYRGFECADEFVVGYGMDYAEKYRNLPEVGILRRSVYMSK